MRKNTTALAAFVLLMMAAFLPSNATAKVPNLLNSPESKLFKTTPQCLICGYALKNTSDNTGITGVKIRVTNQSTLAYYETYTDYYGYYSGPIDLYTNWTVEAIDGTPDGNYFWVEPYTRYDSYTNVNCDNNPYLIHYLPFVIG